VGGVLTQLSVTVAYAALPTLVVQAVDENETGVANAVNSIARSVGQAVAELAVAAAGRTDDAGSSLVVGHRAVELPVAEAELSRLVSGGAETVVTELFDWYVGDLRLVSMPGEPLSAFAAAVPRTGPVLTVGLAPSWQGYLPHPDAMDGGYEDSLGLGGPAMRVLLDALGG
jgi:hypothetical protein